MVTLVPDITAVDWSPRLHAPGAVVEDVDDIAQCLGIILTTPLGSDPHRPDFGADLLPLLDRPIAEAMPQVIAVATEALVRWEPRAAIDRIKPAYDPFEPARLTLRVHWAPAERPGAGSRATEVRVA